MPDRRLVSAGLAGGIAGAICCGAPVFAVTLGTAGVTAWLAAGAYVLIPALLVCLGLVFYRLNRRHDERLSDLRTKRLGNQSQK